MDPEETLSGIKNSYPFIRKLSELTLEFIKRFQEKRKIEIY